MFEYLKLFYYLLNPNSIFLRRTSHSLGDNLLITVVLPKLREKFPAKKIIVETEWKELFYNNPYPTWVTEKHFTTTKRHFRTTYKIDETSNISLYKQLLNSVNLEGIESPKLFLSETEIQNAKIKFPFNYIVTCPVGVQTFSANRKEWGFDNFQQLRKLLSTFEFIQIGAENDPLLENVHDARGLDIRKSAAILNNSLFFIGLEGGLMHVAKSVEKKAAIIYGGMIDPKISGYDNFINIYNKTYCSPCFNSHKKHTICDSMICMKEITPEYVYQRLIEKGFIENEN